MARNRITSAIIPAAFGIGWMLSPESFLLLGNAAGQLGHLVIAALVLAASAHFIHAGSTGGERAATGNRIEFVLETGANLSVAIAAGTLILASAGYAFNEVFAVWFPNLLFSFCLLFLILAVNLAGPRASDTFQIILIGVVAISFFILLAMGLVGSPAQVPNVSGGNIESPAPWRYAFWLPVLFFGYHLSSETRDKTSVRYGSRWVIPAMAVFFILWAIVSLKWIAPYRLSNLTIPHILVARAIGGEFGRVLIGLVIVCGGAAAVNLLVRGTSGKLAKWSRLGYLPTIFNARIEAPPVPLILVSVGIGAMMGFGMAGESITEVFMRGGLLMWLAMMAYQAFSNFRSKDAGSGKVAVLYSGLVFLVSMVMFLVTDSNLFELLQFTAAMIMFFVLCSFFRKVSQKSDGYLINRCKGLNPAEPGCEQC